MGSDLSCAVYSCAHQTPSHLSYSVDEENTVYLLFNSSTDNYNPNPQSIRTHYEGLIGPMVIFSPVKLGRNFENALHFCLFLAKKSNVFCKSNNIVWCYIKSWCHKGAADRAVYGDPWSPATIGLHWSLM